MSRRVRRHPAGVLATFAAASVAAVLVSPATASAVPSAGPADPGCLSAPIAARWAEVGGAAGRLGPVVACTTATRAGTGSFATFARGSVHDHPGTGTWDVSGAFRVRWSGLGWEDGVLGRPASGEEPAVRGGVLQEYERGTLSWSPATGARAVRGAVEELPRGRPAVPAPGDGVHQAVAARPPSAAGSTGTPRRARRP